MLDNMGWASGACVEAAISVLNAVFITIACGSRSQSLCTACATASSKLSWAERSNVFATISILDASEIAEAASIQGCFATLSRASIGWSRWLTNWANFKSIKAAIF
jgi:hypothetical protein